MVVAKRKRRKRAASEKPKKPSIKEWREMRREAWRNRPNKFEQHLHDIRRPAVTGQAEVA